MMEAFRMFHQAPRWKYCLAWKWRGKKVAACEKDGSGRFPAKEANSDMIIQPDEEAAESSGVVEYLIIYLCEPSVRAQ